MLTKRKLTEKFVKENKNNRLQLSYNWKTIQYTQIITKIKQKPRI